MLCTRTHSTVFSFLTLLSPILPFLRPFWNTETELKTFLRSKGNLDLLLLQGAIQGWAWTRGVVVAPPERVRARVPRLRYPRDEIYPC